MVHFLAQARGGFTLNDFPTLITDRTDYDVIYATELIERIKLNGIDSITPEERDEWFAGLKGRYTITDLNRVESAVATLADMLNNSGYSVSVETRSWAFSDVPTPDDMDRYLRNIDSLVESFYVLPDTPQRPDNMEQLGYEAANAIEQILFDIFTLFNNMGSSQFHLGEIYLGEV